MFLGPETSQETLKKPKSRPRSTQRAPKARKKSTNKNQDKCTRGKKCLKPAISFLAISGTHFRTQNCTSFKQFLHNLLNTLQINVETHVGTQFGIRAAQEGQDEPKRTIRSFKEPKTFISKNLKKPTCFLKVFGYRGISRKPLEAQDGSQKTPEKSKTPKIGIQN